MTTKVVKIRNKFRTIARHEPFVNPVATLFPAVDIEHERETEEKRERSVSRRSSQRHQVFRFYFYTSFDIVIVDIADLIFSPDIISSHQIGFGIGK